jgi:hypothetical protein
VRTVGFQLEPPVSVTMKAGCDPMVVYGTLVETRKGDQTQGVA